MYVTSSTTCKVPQSTDRLWAEAWRATWNFRYATIPMTFLAREIREHVVAHVVTCKAPQSAGALVVKGLEGYMEVQLWTQHSNPNVAVD